MLKSEFKTGTFRLNSRYRAGVTVGHGTVGGPVQGSVSSAQAPGDNLESAKAANRSGHLHTSEGRLYNTNIRSYLLEVQDIGLLTQTYPGREWAAKGTLNQPVRQRTILEPRSSASNALFLYNVSRLECTRPRLLKPASNQFPVSLWYRLDPAFPLLVIPALDVLVPDVLPLTLFLSVSMH